MVDAEKIADYKRDGVVCIRSVISPELAREMLTSSVALMDQTKHDYASALSAKTRMGNTSTVEVEPGRFFSGVYLSESYPEFRDFALKSPLPKYAAELMQSKKARFFYDQLFIKEPGTVSPTLWHHDMPFWPLSGSDLISCWVALTPSTIASSGLEYIAGSHRWDKFYRATAPFLHDEELEPAPNFSDASNREGHEFLSWDMEPGDVLFHHPLTVHGAGANHSQTSRRVGLSIRYIGDDARWTPRKKAMSLPREPNVNPGEYPADDDAFPVAWATSNLEML